MSSDFYSRDEEVARGSIPLDIDNVHMLLQGQSASRVDLLMLRYESCSQGGASELLFGPRIWRIGQHARVHALCWSSGNVCDHI